MHHDIRDQIPRTDQTNPAKFPPYVFRPYPKMPHDENGKPYMKADKSCVVVNDAAEEALFHADPKSFGAIIKASVPAAGVTALVSNDDEVAKLRAEIAALKADKPERKKPGRKPKIVADAA